MSVQVAQRQAEAALARAVHSSNKEKNAIRSELAEAENDKRALEQQLRVPYDLEKQ